MAKPNVPSKGGKSEGVNEVEEKKLRITELINGL
jgi:hypothetical protein